jgi:DNA-binding FadR family transcriptional regulator
LHRSQNAAFFSSVVGEFLNNLKLGCRIANCIEEDLIRRNWPAGIVYGSESELIERFQTGRNVIREAVRVLEAHGSARMRSGPKGGLQVLLPSRAQSVEIAAEHALLLGAAGGTDEARRLLEKVKIEIDRSIAQADAGRQSELQQIRYVALPFFEELVEAVDRFGWSSDVAARNDSNVQPLFHRSRAAQVVRQLIAQYTPEQWLQGMRLGSTFDLCERFAIDRTVLRQAIRILESMGMAVSLRGRGYGLVTQTPRRASICRLISCHFAAHGLSSNAAMMLFGRISVQAVAKVAELATAADNTRIEEALKRLERASAAEHAEAVFQTDESQFSILNNPLIELFLNGTKAFAAWLVPEIENVGRGNDVYLTETRKVAAAIARNDVVSAAAAQELKHRRLAESFGYS